jgi:uncharacterized protein involved in outer membrane biogenesis
MTAALTRLKTVCAQYLKKTNNCMQKKWIIILSIAAILLLARIIAPYVLLNVSNKKLEAIEKYDGNIKDVDLRLYKGAYIIKEVAFNKNEGDFSSPFMAANRVEVRIDPSALFKHGKWVAYVIIDSSEINFTRKWKGVGQQTKIAQTGMEVNWLEHFQQLSPLSFNRLEIRNSRINITDHTTKPTIYFQVRSIQVDADNLQNITKVDSPMPGSMHVSAITTGNGKADISMKIDFKNKPPDLDLDFAYEGADMTEWNRIFRAFTDMDLESGQFFCYSELKIKNGDVDGYIKPVMENIEILDHDGSFLEKIKEAIAEGVKKLAENEKTDQVSSQVPISGTIKDPDIGTIEALSNILKNAFVEAYHKELNRTIE